MNTETNTSWHPAAATIFVQLGRDPHLATCELAKASGPDATLACACCGRAQWMHATRHDTCGQFCWVTEDTLTDKQIAQLGTIADLPATIRQACAKALNSYALGAGLVRDARRECAAAINTAKRKAPKVQ